MNSYYECSECSYKSTRKTNANRHIILRHKGNARAFNLKTGLDSSKQSNNHLTHKANADILAEDDYFFQSIEKMKEPFEALEKLASVFPPKMRNYYLSNILEISLLTRDPAACLKSQVKASIPLLFLRKLATYLADTKSLSVVQAEVFIRTAITSTYQTNDAISEKKSGASFELKDMDRLLSQAAITCLFNKKEARSMVLQILKADPENSIGKTILDYIDSNP